MQARPRLVSSTALNSSHVIQKTNAHRTRCPYQGHLGGAQHREYALSLLSVHPYPFSHFVLSSHVFLYVSLNDFRA